MLTTTRRLVLRHTAGPYPGLRQILGHFTTDLDTADLPDKLDAITISPDGRVANALRLKSTPAYVVYVEQAAQAEEEPAA